MNKQLFKGFPSDTDAAPSIQIRASAFSYLLTTFFCIKLRDSFYRRVFLPLILYAINSPLGNNVHDSVVLQIQCIHGIICM